MNCKDCVYSRINRYDAREDLVKYECRHPDTETRRRTETAVDFASGHHPETSPKIVVDEEALAGHLILWPTMYAARHILGCDSFTPKLKVIKGTKS